MTSLIPLALLLLAACTIHEAKQIKDGCHRLITQSHLRNLSDLIDSQMKTTCKRSFCYVDESELGNVECFLRAAYVPVFAILDKIEFKSNTPNSEKLKHIKELRVGLGGCFEEVEEKLCTKRFDVTVEEMLKLVHSYFRKAKDFLSNAKFGHDCSSIFQKCSHCQEKEEAGSTGVVTDQDCPCRATRPNSGGGSPPADQLDSKDAADGNQQLFVLPDTTQMQGMAERSTRPRVLRSTQMGSRATESMDFRAGTDTVMSLPAEEQPLTAAPQESHPQPMNTISLLDPAITLDQFSRQLKNGPPSFSSQHHTESPVSSSGAGRGQAWPNELLSKSAHLPDLSKPPIRKQWLQTGEMNEAITGLLTDWDTAGTTSTPSLALVSSAGLKPVDSSKMPPSGRWVTLSTGDPASLYHIPASGDPVSATQQPSRLVANTNKPSSPGQISPESGSWGEAGSRGRAHGAQQSTQLRERRAERNEGLARDRQPEDSMQGPGFDLSFIPPNTDRHTKKPEPSDTRGMAVSYVVVPSVLGILLAVGGLLFYLHKSRFVARRRLQRNESNVERPEEGRPLNNREEHMELQIQGEL